ncbi:hypothetical protein CFT61_02750 [Segatella copri]|uniref:Uncharacterized protein n=1 Tax=Segatella copri TaxID=165179 RepID=A0AA91TLW2_9BACT|nr:hypothetical protein [Prevotella sp.]OXL45160.1 hypothetical protein CFT61_02750 [Segatella copri]
MMKYRASFLRDSVFVLLVVEFAMSYTYCLILNIDFFQFFRDSTFIEQKSTRVIQKIVLTLQP